MTSKALKYYQTMRQSNINDGSGPMVPDLAFSSYELAASYIDDQPGIQGRRAKWSTEKYGDWRINEVEVVSTEAELELIKKYKSRNNQKVN